MENKIDSKAIGERIKEARSKLKMSQHQLSIATGISTTQLSAYENGKKTIGLLNFSKLAIALNVSMDELYWASPLIHPAATNENYGAIVVNCTLELYEKGIVNQTFIPIGNNGYSDDEIPQLSYIKYQDILMTMIEKLRDFEANKDTYPDPNGFKKQIIASAAKQINNYLSQSTKK